MIGHILIHPIRADFDEDSLIVYQAYSDLIGKEAARCNTLNVPGFSQDRMTWIKPSFLWMMYRCGWGQKDERQTTILRIRMKTSAFTTILENSVLSNYSEVQNQTHGEWRQVLKRLPNRIQWDPDRDEKLNRLERRAIQVGIAPEFVGSYVASILKIEDITDLCQAIHREIRETGTSSKLPSERVLPLF